MRILIFGPYPQRDRPIEGGVMAVVGALAQGLAQRPDAEVAVATASPGDDHCVEHDGAVTIYRLGIPRFPRTRNHRRIRRELVETAHDFHPSVIHAHGTGYYAAAALDGLWPVIITAHGVVYEEAQRSGARGWKERLAWKYDARMERQVLRRARRMIAISPYIRHAFDAYPHLEWTDIPNPVDERFFHIQPRPQPGRLFTPARVIPRKGVDILIHAFSKIAHTFPEATLRIAGETETAAAYVAKCRAMVLAAKLGERVRFLGNLAKDELLEEYRCAMGVVLPARQETAPVAIAEALAVGRPVIASQVGGVPWMVQQQHNGLLVPPDDPDALAQALARLLSGGEEVTAWAQNARSSAAIYRPDAVLKATLAAYERAISG